MTDPTTLGRADIIRIAKDICQIYVDRLGYGTILDDQDPDVLDELIVEVCDGESEAPDDTDQVGIMVDQLLAGQWSEFER